MSLLQNLSHDLIPPDRTLFPFWLKDGTRVMGTFQDYLHEQAINNLGTPVPADEPLALNDVYPGMPAGYVDDITQDDAII